MSFFHSIQEPYLSLCRLLRSVIPEVRIHSDLFTRLARSADASFYHLVPALIVEIRSEAEMIHLLACCSRLQIPVTFKAGGTSLSGQTLTDSVLVETGTGWHGFSLSDDQNRVNLQCGLTGAAVNTRLLPFRRRIGPDPSSIGAARIGGIVANNASGGAFGIRYNSYNTLRGIRVILSDGSLLDTRDEQSVHRFRKSHAGMLEDLDRLSRGVRNDPVLADKIRNKYTLKNTCGYGLNSLIDFHDPVEMLAHLMVGSEGTLGFISEVTLQTIELLPLKATALLYFSSLREACEALPVLTGCNLSAAELMDRNALRAMEDKPGIPAEIKNLPHSAAALLLETSANSAIELEAQMNKLLSESAGFNLLGPLSFSTDSASMERIWKVRKGLFTSAAAGRPAGTACIIEDLAFRMETLADALESVQALIDRYEYKQSVLWGHILDGNIHFLVFPRFSDPESPGHYGRFMDELVELVIGRFNGSLKGEHGTGRNMAPFVRKEWGDDLYQVMHRIKDIFDPGRILNRDVLLNDDPVIHLKSIKTYSPVDPLIDSCIECGFCEPVCPSKDLTLTPRQRIVVYRALTGNIRPVLTPVQKRRFKQAFSYQGEKTCATDGLCALSCPVDINTGSLVKNIRARQSSPFSRLIAHLAADHLKEVSASLRFVLKIGGRVHKKLGGRVMRLVSSLLHRITLRAIPRWHIHMPDGALPVHLLVDQESMPRQAVYLPSCINRTMGNSADMSHEPGIAEVTVRLLNKAGYGVRFPENLMDLCCGMAFRSKGFYKQADRKARQLELALLKATENGKLPVLCDMSPCFQTMREHLDNRLKMYDPVGFIDAFLAEHLIFEPIERTIVLHPVCSLVKMGLEKTLQSIAEKCAKEVVVPAESGCCGWAGDKGFTHPALNASALRYLKPSIPANAKFGYSTSRTCEIGLSLHSGIVYKSLLYLVDEATRAK